MKLVFLLLLLPIYTHANVTVGSKAFTEGYLTGELLAQQLESNDFTVDRKFGMGATGILFEALKGGQIQVYPEYTGTIAQAILKDEKLRSFESIQEALNKMGLVMSHSIGFDNNYSLAVSEKFSRENGLHKLSDLKRVEQKIRPGISHEFISRADGWVPLTRAYGLQLSGGIQAMEHTLAYQAIANDAVNLIDVYSTDAKIQTLGLVVLEDDLHFLPRYEAVILARKDFISREPKAWAALTKLEGSLSEPAMRALNNEVDGKGVSFREAILHYLNRVDDQPRMDGALSRLIQRTKEHCVLVGIALLFSIIVGIPLGLLSARYAVLGQGILLTSGLVQTIPSLALLCFLIPLFGIGLGSALVALCLYGLLPVVMNTFIGIRSIDPAMIDVAQALGLTRTQQLWRIKLPLASRNILAGIRTSAVISIGTATLAALIGAGGYGATIISGLALNDMHIVFQGAAPAAVLALAVHGIFEGLNRVLIPRGIQYT